MLDDKYRIERLLAVGGMGAVYVGTHIKLRKRVAIKVLNPQLNSAAMIERFHREAITASQIGHEGIAQVTDIGTSQDGEPFLVMEYLEGEPLASRLRSSGPLAIEDACELACSILSPLAAAHRAGIVHRDLKPDNVFLVRQSRGEMVKLLDFGISRAAGLESEFRLTTTGLVLGTPYYMSPEQARGDHEITPAADLYAIGVILYEMLIGCVPIQAENYNQLMYRVMIGDYARPRDKRPDLPDGLEQLIVQAMAQEPTQRPISATDLEQALLVYCRPAFRDRISGRLSAPAMPLPTGSGSYGPGSYGPGGYGSGSGVGTARNPSTHRTMPAGSNASAPAIHTPAPPGAATRPALPGKRRSRAPWIAGALIVLGGGGAAAVIALGGDPTGGGGGPSRPVAPTPVAPTPAPTPPAPTPVAPATPDPSAVKPVEPPAAPVEPPAAPAEPAKLTLKFAIDPPDATITVDGARVAGSELVVAKDNADHALRIAAPGRVTHDEILRFDESQRLVVQLKRATGPAHGTPATPSTKNRTDHEVITDSPY
jgi:serine/threonine-protein kinase